MVGDFLTTSEQTKTLRLVGQVTVSSDGDIIDLTVNTADALPGDPMRVTWERRAERDPEFLARTLSTLQYGSSHGVADTFAKMQGIGMGAQEIAKMVTAMQNDVGVGAKGVADTFARMQNIGIGAQEIADTVAKMQNSVGVQGIAETLAKMQGIGMGAQGIADTLAKMQGIGPGMQGVAETQHRSVRRERPSEETDHFVNPDLPSPEQPH